MGRKVDSALIEYHNCPKHGKERCFRDPENPTHHFCQHFNFKERVQSGAWDEMTLNEVLDSAKIDPLPLAYMTHELPEDIE